MKPNQRVTSELKTIPLKNNYLAYGRQTGDPQRHLLLTISSLQPDDFLARKFRRKYMRDIDDLLSYKENHLPDNLNLNESDIVIMRDWLDTHFVCMDIDVISAGELTVNECLKIPKIMERIIPGMTLDQCKSIMERDEERLRLFYESDEFDNLPFSEKQQVSMRTVTNYFHNSNIFYEYKDQTIESILNLQMKDIMDIKTGKKRNDLRDLIVYLNRFDQILNALTQMNAVDEINQTYLYGQAPVDVQKTAFKQRPTEAQLNTPVQALNLPKRVGNALFRIGVNTVGQLLDLTYDEFIRIRNLGSKSTEQTLIQGKRWADCQQITLEDTVLYGNIDVK